MTNNINHANYTGGSYGFVYGTNDNYWGTMMSSTVTNSRRANHLVVFKVTYGPNVYATVRDADKGENRYVGGTIGVPT